jgi:hypothetical protein
MDFAIEIVDKTIWQDEFDAIDSSKTTTVKHKEKNSLTMASTKSNRKRLKNDEKTFFRTFHNREETP